MKRLLLRLPNWIGDAVMATATLDRVRTMFPSSHIIALAQPHILELFEGLPFFNSTISLDHHNKKSIQDGFSSAQADCCILFTGSFSSAWHAYRAHIPMRIGFSCHFRRLLLTHPLPVSHDETLHDVLRYLRLLSPFHPIEQLDTPRLFLHVREEEKQCMRKRLELSGIHPWHKLLIVNPGAAYGEAKCWPSKYFKDVLQQLAKEENLYVIVVGSHSTVPLAEELAALSPEKILSFTGKTSLRELIALLSLSNGLLSNDSGPMHIAAALQTPLVAIFGSTNPLRTGPWQWGTVLYEQSNCSPCYRRNCRKTFQCMLRITPQAVLRAIRQMFETHHHTYTPHHQN